MDDSSPREDSESSIRRLDSHISDRLKEIRTYLKITRAQRILRRYFVMNAFDGAMTSLGIVIGAYITHIMDPRTVIGVILVGGMAMAVSGFAGTYMTESAERVRSLNELEDAMLMSLERTIHGEASRFVPILAGLVDGSAPFLASLPSISAFALALIGPTPIHNAYLSSTGASLATLFLLGVFLGRISKSNAIYSGIKMVVAGMVVTVLALLINGGL